MSAPATKFAAPSRRLGVIGSIVGLLAFVAVALPHWVVPMVAPPPPTDQVIVDTGHRLKDRLIARVKGTEYQAPRREASLRDHLNDWSAMAASFGLLAIALAVVALVFREEKLMAGVAAVLGDGALVVEISPFIIGMVIAMMPIYSVLSFVGVLYTR
jgi:hypothetical protein